MPRVQAANMEEQLNGYFISTTFAIAPYPTSIALYRGIANVHKCDRHGEIVHTAECEGLDAVDAQSVALRVAMEWAGSQPHEPQLSK